MLDLNISRVTELHYTNCTGAHSALRIKIDFEDFGTDPYFKVLLLYGNLDHLVSHANLLIEL